MSITQEEPDLPHEQVTENFSSRLKRTPLPIFHLSIIFLIQFAEPVTATVIYPFINKFVRDTGVTGTDEAKTGYFAGVIESIFFLAEACTVFQWGYASDRLGRKPVLLLGPIGLSLSMLCFGLSRKFSMLVVARCFQGIFNGNIGVSKTMIAEVTDSTNIADAYALIPAMWSVGSTIGPIIGGILSEPALRWPTLFGNSVFHQHPYFLPCAVAALIAFISFPIGLLGLKETLPSAVLRQKQRKAETSRVSVPILGSTTRLLADNPIGNYGSIEFTQNDSNVESGLPHSTKDHPTVPPPSRALLSPRLLGIYGLLAFIDMCTSVLQPLVYSTSIPFGGLSFDPYHIGIIMGVWGVINAIAQIRFSGPLIRRIGPSNVLMLSMSSYTVVLLLYPLLSFFTRRAGKVDIITSTILCIQLICALTNASAYGATQVIIAESTPKESLGAANGLAQAVASGMRACAPSFASSLFSISLERHLLGGNFVFLFLAGIGLVGVRLAFVLPNTKYENVTDIREVRP